MQDSAKHCNKKKATAKAKCRETLCSWTETLKIIVIYLLINLHIEHNINQYSCRLSLEFNKMILKFIWKCKECRIAKTKQS